MIYMVTQATGDGTAQIDVVFKPGTNIDQAQVLVQNRVAIAIPRLPEEVQRIGVTVKKKSPDLMMVVHLISPDGSLDQSYISNYATIHIKDVLTRVDGVGDTVVFGARDYSMRIWLDPAKVQSRNLTSSDVVAALRAANVQVAAGAINQPPAKSPAGFQVAVETLGRLQTPEQFADIIVATDAGRPRHAGARHRARRAWRVYLRVERLSRRQGCHRNRHLSAAGLQRADDRSGRDQDDGRAVQGLPAGPCLPRCLQHHRVRPAIGRRGDQDAVRSGRAGRARHHPVPADMARRDHPRRRHPGVADRHVLRHGELRLLAQQSHAVRSRAGDRHRGGRRDRRRGERRALSERGHESARGRAQDHG